MMKRLLAGVSGVVLAFAVGCSGNEPIQQGGTGSLTVTAQALTEGMVDEVRVTVVPVDGGVFDPRDPSDMIGDTYVLGYNGKEWTSTFRGIKSGCYELTAQAYRDDELVFATNTTVRACVPVGSTATANLVILHQVGHDGLKVPAIRWITTDATTVRPGEVVKIRVGFEYAGDEEVHLSLYEARGGSAADGYDDGPPNSLSIGWRAPSTPDDGRDFLDALEPIIFELNDGIPDSSFNVRFNVFIRVIWHETDPLNAAFRLNLAPEITNITVSPSNPSTGILGNILHGRVSLSFVAMDEGCSPAEETCGRPTFNWEIPDECEDFRMEDGEGSFEEGSTVLSANGTLFYPMLGGVSQCVLTLTITDSEGAVTSTNVTIVPFEESVLYTPTVAIDFRFGDEARPGFGLLFGVLANYRLDYLPAWSENLDWWVDLPKVFWRLGDGDWQVDEETEIITDDTVADEELLQRYVATRSQFEWTVEDRSDEEDSGFCESEAGERWVNVTAMVCHPLLDSPDATIEFLPVDFADLLCDEVVFRVDVPDAGSNIEQVCGSTPPAP